MFVRTARVGCAFVEGMATGTGAAPPQARPAAGLLGLLALPGQEVWGLEVEAAMVGLTLGRWAAARASSSAISIKDLGYKELNVNHKVV